MVVDKIKMACDRWKSVANFNCVEVRAGQAVPSADLAIFVSLSGIQTVDPVTKAKLFRTNGTASNFCGMIHDQTDKDGKVVPGTYTTFSCATVGYGVYDSNGLAKRHSTAFIAIHRQHLGSDNVFVHEVGHLLGLAHPQIRNDRDNFVTLNPNFSDSYSRYSDYEKTNRLPGYGTDFDFGSMLTYRFPHSTAENFLTFSANLNQLTELVKSGAAEIGHARFSEWSLVAGKVSNGAYAMKDQLYESQYPHNNSSRMVGGAYPSPDDARTASELYGPAQATLRKCQFNAIEMPHGTRVGAYLNGQPTQVGDYCAVVPVVCNDGALSHASRITTCAARCTIGGQNIKLGERADFFETTSVPAGQVCTRKSELCIKEKLGTSLGYATCTPDQPAVVGQCVAATSPVTQLSSGSCVKGSVPAAGSVGAFAFSVADNAFKWTCNAAGGNASCSQPAITCPSGQVRQGSGTAASPFNCQAVAQDPGQCPSVTSPVSQLSNGSCVKGSVPAAGSVGAFTFSSLDNAFKWNCNSAGGNASCSQPAITCPAGQTREGNGTSNAFYCKSISAVPACTYSLSKSDADLIGSQYAVIEAGESVIELIACSNLPSGAVVKVIGTANGQPQIDVAITLDAQGKFKGKTVNNDPKIAATYNRIVQVLVDSNPILTTPTVTAVVKTDVQCPAALAPVRKMDEGTCAQGTPANFYFDYGSSLFKWKCKGAGGEVSCTQSVIRCPVGKVRDGDGSSMSPFICVSQYL